MKRICLCALLMLLAACTLPFQPAATETPTPAPSATAAPTAAAIPTPLPTLTAVRTSNPQGVAGSPQVVKPDCKLFPAAGGCGAGLPFKGRLALLGAAGDTLYVLDSRSGSLYASTAARGVSRLDWVAGGGFLAVTEADGQRAAYWASPELSSSAPDLPPSGGAAQVTAGDGSTAWMEAKEGQAVFHVRLAGASAEQRLTVEAQDRLIDLLGWVPGAPARTLLCGYHFGGNAMWLTGDHLFTLDARSGQVSALSASMLLDSPLRWQPGGTLLALRDTGAGMEGRAAVLDTAANTLKLALPEESGPVREVGWSADGRSVLVSMAGGGAGESKAVAAGIYLVGLEGGSMKRLTQPPAGSTDDFLAVLADGSTFLFMRQASGSSQPAEVRLGTLDGRLDALAVGGVARADERPSGNRWGSVVAYWP